MLYGRAEPPRHRLANSRSPGKFGSSQRRNLRVASRPSPPPPPPPPPPTVTPSADPSDSRARFQLKFNSKFELNFQRQKLKVERIYFNIFCSNLTLKSKWFYFASNPGGRRQPTRLCSWASRCESLETDCDYYSIYHGIDLHRPTCYMVVTHTDT